VPARWGHSPIRAIVYAKEPEFLNKDCQIKSTDTGFRRCLFSLRGIGTNRLFVLFRRSGFFYSQYAGYGRDQSTDALTSLEVGQFASRLDSLLLNIVLPYGILGPIEEPTITVPKIGRG